MNRRYYRSGFSLIELLIVVAIIAALVGVAVPMFQKNIADSRITKAKQDIDTLKQQVVLHDSQERPLTGISLDPLKGRYLQEIPSDPWGNAYLIDANVGVIVSWGADQKAGGLDEDADIVVHYKAPLQIQKVQYNGSWGYPLLNNYMKITWTKPYTLGSAGNVLKNLLLITDTTQTGAYISLDGSAKAGLPTGVTGWGCTWVINDGTKEIDGSALGSGSFAGVHSNAANGIMFVGVTAPQAQANTQIKISSSMAMNVASAAAGVTALTTTDISEVYTKGGPLDQGLWGTMAPSVGTAQALAYVGTENRGVPIERISSAQ